MYIRQEYLLSFEEIIKLQPKTKIELILSQLDFTNILAEISKFHAVRGSKGHSELALICSIVTMQIDKIKTVNGLVERLKTDPIFRYVCGFDIIAQTPSASTFSRFLSKISSSDAVEKDFEALVLKAKELGIIDGTNVAIDATKIEAYLNPKYYIMDSGYDQQKNYDYIAELGAQAIIAYNPRGSYVPPEGLNERLHPICSMGYELTYWGIDGDFLKFRCPHATNKINCPFGVNWCSSSSYGYCHKVNYKDKENNRLFSYPHRSSNAWRELYNKRTSIERCNSRLKEYLSADNVRSAGIRKAKTIAFLNCMALIAGTIAANSNLHIAADAA